MLFHKKILPEMPAGGQGHGFPEKIFHPGVRVMVFQKILVFCGKLEYRREI
jgi:hypothetical protein